MKDRNRVDNSYNYYRTAAAKAGEHDDRRQLERGLSLARNIYEQETWRVFAEEISPTDPPTKLDTVTSLPAEKQSTAIFPPDAPTVVSLLDYKENREGEGLKMKQSANTRTANFFDRMGQRQFRGKPQSIIEEKIKRDQVDGGIGLVTPEEEERWRKSEARMREYLLEHPNTTRWIGFINSKRLP
jgi:hypothetical protein